MLAWFMHSILRKSLNIKGLRPAARPGPCNLLIIRALLLFPTAKKLRFAREFFLDTHCE